MGEEEGLQCLIRTVRAQEEDQDHRWMIMVDRRWIVREAEDVDRSHMVILVREEDRRHPKTKDMVTKMMDTMRLCRRDTVDSDLHRGV